MRNEKRENKQTSPAPKCKGGSLNVPGRWNTFMYQFPKEDLIYLLYAQRQQLQQCLTELHHKPASPFNN